jgi:Uncharacterized protein conserved in bacteria (DUF2188)
MKRVDLVKKGDQWFQEGGGRAIGRGPLKSEALKKTAQAARRDPDPVTLKIHKENGRIQEERTYPRRADPRRSKG